MLRYFLVLRSSTLSSSRVQLIKLAEYLITEAAHVLIPDMRCPPSSLDCNNFRTLVRYSLVRFFFFHFTSLKLICLKNAKVFVASSLFQVSDLPSSGNLIPSASETFPLLTTSLAHFVTPKSIPTSALKIRTVLTRDSRPISDFA